ncbi:MAG: CheR family methyltransferase [Acidobacteriota bacterium]
MSLLAAEEGFRKFQYLVRERTGISFPDSKREELMRIVKRKSIEAGFADIDGYYRALRSAKSSPLLQEKLIAAVTVGETYFFRYKEQWRLLSQVLLPELIRRKRASGSLQLRVWSAGCSTGEEPYSLAITLLEAIPDRHDWRIFLLATDLNLSSLQTARIGIYGKWSFRSTPPDVLKSYFRPIGAQYQIIKPVRNMVSFNAQNITASDYPSLSQGIHDMDLILCRNVLIYFDEDRIRETSRRLHDTLAEGGYLLLGHSEPTHLMSRRFRIISERGIVYCQRPERVLTAASKAIPSARATSPPPRQQPAAATEDPAATARGLLAEGRRDESINFLLSLPEAARARPAVGLLLAEIYAGAGRYDDARRWTEQVLRTDPLEIEAYRMSSMISEAMEQYDEAIEYARKGLFLDPSSVLTLYQLGCLYRRKGDLRKARKCHESVSRLIESLPEDQLLGGDVGVTVGRMREAVKGLIG